MNQEPVAPIITKVDADMAMARHYRDKLIESVAELERLVEDNSRPSGESDAVCPSAPAEVIQASLECESCGTHVNFINKNWLGIRCVYCQRVFCEPCAIIHFEPAAEAKSIIMEITARDNATATLKELEQLMRTNGRMCRRCYPDHRFVNLAFIPRVWHLIARRHWPAISRPLLFDYRFEL